VSNQKAVDLSEFEAQSPKTSRCWFKSLSEDQRAKVTAAREAGYGAPTIAKVVSGWGIPITKSPVLNHFGETHRCD